MGGVDSIKDKESLPNSAPLLRQAKVSVQIARGARDLQTADVSKPVRATGSVR